MLIRRERSFFFFMRNINTLKNSLQFKEVYSAGKSLANRYLVIYALPVKGDFRLGISVSKKVGNSVVRHHITRLIRESYLFYKPLLPDGYHIVVVARKTACQRSFQDIRDAFGHLLKKHGILTDGGIHVEENADSAHQIL